MFLVASVFVPAVASADTGSTNTIKVLGAPTINPPATGGSFTVNIVANGSVPISGAGSGLAFDNTKLTLTAIAKDAVETGNGVSYLGFPGAGAPTSAFIAAANASGQIPNISWTYLDGSSSESANADHGVFSATFTVTATGDSVLTPNASPTLLDGQAATYGVSLTVTPVNGTVVNSFSPIWSLSTPGTAAVLTGATSAGYTVTVAVSQGSPGTISLSATGLPSGVSANFSPASGSNAFTSTLTFTATAAAALGTSNVTVTATDASLVTHSQTVSLTVVGNNDYSLNASPNSLSVNGGATSPAATISTAVLTGTPGTISLSATGLPTGVTANFVLTSVAAGSGTTVTFSADNTAVNGVSTVTISGSNGTYTRTATISLNVIVITGVGATVNVTGSLDAGFLGLTCPTSLSIPLLRGSTNQLNVPCQVYTNTAWNLSVADTVTDAYTGHMVTGRPMGGSNHAVPDTMHVLSRSFISGGDTFYGNNLDLGTGAGTTCSVLQQPCQPANQGSLSGGVVLNGTNSAAAPLVLSQYVAANTQPGTYGMQVLFKAVSVF
jgi:hypothetical protein